MRIIDWLKQPITVVLALVGIGCFPLPAQRGEFTKDEFDRMAVEMASGNVATINPEDVDQHRYHLLDARPQQEYDVSHLPGAIVVGYDDFAIDNVLSKVPVMDTVVVYCSVGYRSGKIGEKLQRAGYKNVYNLSGGIFGWANDGHSLVNLENKETKKVHGFNKKWSKWLKKEIPVVY